MLTKQVINTVKAIDSLTNQLDSICKQRDEFINDIKQLIIMNDSEFGSSYVEIEHYSIVDKPQGKRRPNGVYVIEQCDDSLYCPDSGSGTLFYPIENEDKYLRVDFYW